MAENRITLPEPPKAVFDVLLDARCYPEWVIGAKRVRSVDPEWPAAGSSFHHALGAGPAELKDTTTMVAFEPPLRVELEAHFRPAGAAHIEIELAPSDDGAETTLTMRERPVEDPSGLLRTKVVDVLTHARNELALRRLRRLVERRVPMNGTNGAAPVGAPRPGAPKTKAELMKMAQQRDLPGRSKMKRDELARALGES